MDEKELKDYFAAHAMLAVMQETQETRVASFWDWIKNLLVIYLNFTFLNVKRIQIKGVIEDSSKKAWDYAEAMIEERKKRNG